jgi:sec-independent protein translocase protein TatC
MDYIVDLIMVPHYQAQAMIQKDFPGVDPAKVFPGTYTGPFFSYFKLCIVVSLFFASPIIGYQMWQFIAAGLYKSEKKWVYLFGPLSFGLFVSGCVFGYSVLIPYALYFMAKLSDPTRLQQLFAISDYIGLVTLLTIVTGAVFQIPIVMMFFAKLGLIGWKGYLRFWRWAILIIAIVAAVVTPPDPISMILMAVPMIFLYFIGTLLSAAVQPKDLYQRQPTAQETKP